MATSLVQRLLQLCRTIPDSFEQRNPYFILAIVCSAMFLDLANLSAITIALPTIQKELDIGVNNLQWVISAYAITFGAFLLLGGRGGDLVGHRPVLLFGMSFFALFTFVCALAPTFIGLVMARAFQGIGAAFTIPSAQAHIAIYFPTPARKAKAIGFWGASGSMGFILGLILGGIFADLIGWRWIFWISLIFSVVLIPTAPMVLPHAAARHTPDTNRNETEASATDARPPQRNLMQSIKARIVRFDALGIFFGISGILILTYALTSANTAGWGSPQIIATLIISVLLLTAFVFQERATSQALLAPHLFKVTSFNMTLILAINTYAVRQACTYFLTVQLQSFGNSPIHTSVLFIPLGVSSFIANTIAGRLVPILGARSMFILGWSLSIPGVLLFSFIRADTPYWRFTFPAMILYIAGMVAVYITANFVIVSSASKSEQGVAAGIFNVALQVGGSVLGLAVMTAVAQGVEKASGDGVSYHGAYTQVAFQSVYYSCAVLCGVSLLLSLFAIEVPENMRGSYWKRSQVQSPSTTGDGMLGVQPPSITGVGIPTELRETASVTAIPAQ